MTQFTQWLFLTSFILFVLFIVVKVFFYKSVAQKEEKNSAVMKLTLQETEILIRTHQLQLQTALGNIDILTDEITNLRNEVKALKQR
ncbi:MAG: hypothetical protein K2I63_02325, partial [Helicobacter sp.]|nr:hypothetical protein [Helicobacter sp.]